MTRRRRNELRAGVRRSFTLVEMVIAVGIIVILLALTVSASVVIVRRSEVRETQNTLRLLESALLDWEQAVDRKLTWGEEDEPYEDAQYEILYDDRWPYPALNAADDTSMAKLLEILHRLEDTRAVLTQINTDYLVRRAGILGFGDGLQVLDPWGTAIVMVHPGRTYDNRTFSEQDEPDPDGTIRVSHSWGDNFAREETLGICRNRKVCFVSAGPDGRFGDLHLDTAEGALTAEQRAEIEEAADNIYSYDLSQVRP
jgi:type II secretory pathway pseudopilin PulG